MPQGGRLTISTRSLTIGEADAEALGLQPGEYVELAVADTGCGMDAAARGRAFEPFFTSKPDGKGTGLGLAMVYGIARQNGGTARIESEPGQGTTVILLLPRQAPALEALPVPTAPPAPAAARGGGTETVLLVEDEPSLRELAAELLTDLGYHVLPAASPGEALRASEKHPAQIDLLLTDVVMPVMNGRELAERVQAHRPGIRVLFTSGYTADVIARQGVLDRRSPTLSTPWPRKSEAPWPAEAALPLRARDPKAARPAAQPAARPAR